MTRQLLDRTLRTAPTPDPHLWRWAGPAATDVTESGGMLQWNTIINSSAKHVIDLLQTVQTDQGVLLRIQRTGNSTAKRLKVWLSHGGGLNGATGENALNGIAAQVTGDGGLILQRYIAGALTGLGNEIGGKVSTSPMWMRFERTAGRIRVRVWAVGATEPATWDHDVADDGLVPAGRVGISAYSNTGSPAFAAGTISIYTPANGLPAPDRPRLHTRPGGSRIGFGRHSTIREDDATEATPSWLTGTTTLDAVNGLRTLAAAAGATASVTGPVAAGEAHILTVHNLRLGADTETNVALRFSDGTNIFELRQDATDDQVRLVVNGVSTSLVYRITRNGEGPRHRSLTLMLVTSPKILQVIALAGDWRNGSVLGWASAAGAGLSRTTQITPSLQVASTGASPTSASWTGLTVEVQRL